MPNIRPGRVPIHPEAFSHDLGWRRRRPRQHGRDHLKFIRSLPCVVCGSRNNIQAAHIRMANPVYGKRHTGAGEKSSDKFCTSLCGHHHAEQHMAGEAFFWRRYGIDPFQVATSLFAHSGDDEAAELVIKMARK